MQNMTATATHLVTVLLLSCALLSLLLLLLLLLPPTGCVQWAWLHLADLHQHSNNVSRPAQLQPTATHE